jgi:small subunit ribosomal protein S29
MRSLMRPTIQISPRVIAIRSSVAAFSTTIPDLEVRQKKVQVPKKKKAVVHVKKPNPGERKAFRKRIQLSNNSALEVQGLASLEPETMARESNAGQMFALPSDVQDRLRVLEAFKHSQSWNLFRKPHLLVRREVVQLASKLEAAAKDKKALHLVLTGERLTGKTVALLQAMTYGLLNDWVVINIPDGMCSQRLTLRSNLD